MAGEGTGYASLCKVIDGVLGHQGKHAIYILVVDHTEHDAQLFAGLGKYLWHDVLEPTDVVSGIADEAGRGRELLPSTHKSSELANVGKSFTHSTFIDVVSDALQLTDGME